MTNLTIRAATTGDDAAIWAALKPVFRAGDTYTIDPNISRDAALAYWTGASHGAFIAQDGDLPVGTYYLRANQGGGGAHVCNCGYVTARGAEGRGVARAMLDHSLISARNAGFRAMQFNFVVASNSRAIAIWQSYGFDIIGTIPAAFIHPTSGPVDAHIMWKSLV